MNLLADPIFSVTDGTTRSRVSFRDIINGSADGLVFSSGDTFRQIGQVWLAANLVRVLLEGRPYSDTAVLEGVAKWEHAFDLLASSGPRFMQVPFEGDCMTVEGALTVHHLFLPDAPGVSTANPFAFKGLHARRAYCPACAAIDLFTFQMMVPGGGKGAGGPYAAGLIVFGDAGGDAKSSVLCNVPSHVRGQDPNSASITSRVDPLGSTPTWMRPEFTSLLAKGSAIHVSDVNLTSTVLALWLTRQVWLYAEELAEDTECFSCGNPTRTSVNRVDVGRKKSSSTKREAEDLKETGCIKIIGGKVPSIYHPWRASTDPKLRGQIGFLSANKESVSGLLPLMSDLVKHRDTMDWVRPGKNLVVFSTKEKSGSFDGAYLHTIPLCGLSNETLMGAFQRMEGVRSEIDKSMWIRLQWAFTPLAEAQKGKSNPRPECKEVAAGMVRDALAIAADRFPLFLQKVHDDVKFDDTDVEMSSAWAAHMWAAARHAYLEATVPFAGSSPDRWQMLAKNYPSPKGGTPMSDTASTPLLNIYQTYVRTLAHDRGLCADLRRIDISFTGVDATSARDVFAAGLNPQAGPLTDAMIGFASLFPSGLRHEPGVSFGRGLQVACRSSKNFDNTLTRAGRLGECLTVYEFLYYLTALLQETNTLGCDLNILYWDVYTIFIKNDRPRVHRWWLDLYKMDVQVTPPPV